MTIDVSSDRNSENDSDEVRAYLTRLYTRIVVPERDGTYRAEIMEFPGCIATGDTVVEALNNLEEVAAAWLHAALKRHQTIPDPLIHPSRRSNQV